MFGTPWQLGITRPHLLLGLLVLPLLVYVFNRGLVDLGRAQRLLSLLLRCTIALLLVTALAGVVLLRPATRRLVVLAVDESLSVEGRSAQFAQQYAQQLGQLAAAGDRVALVPFARNPGPVQPLPAGGRGTPARPRPQPAADPPAPSGAGPHRGERLASDLAAAIEVARAAIPAEYVPHVVLLSDGNQTQGDAVRAALAAGVPVSTVPLPVSDDPEVQISAVNVPAQVREGEPFDVEVVIDSNHDDQGTVEIFRGDVKVSPDDARPRQIRRGQTRLRFPQQVADQRLVQYTAAISGFQDRLLDNNVQAGLVSAEGKPRALLVDSDPQQTLHLQAALQQQGITVVVRPAAGIPTSLSDLQDHDVILLSNVPAAALSQNQMDVMRTFVQDLGGGLIMLGGDHSFGLGGYNETTLEELLPVWSDFEKEKEKPSLAIVLAIDKSGSMAGVKIELAKDAAKGAVELLGGRDQIGVLAFDGETYWVSPLHRASDVGMVSERISTIQSGGGTNMYPAMVQAYAALVPAEAQLKHVILLTDGISAPGDFGAITAQLAKAQITVSTVAVGDAADRELLQTIAQQGKGRYYFCEDAQSVPEIFAQETIMASKPALHELPFAPQLIRPTPVLSQIDIGSAPFLLGFVVTRPKPTCELILATESGEPLLVWWRYGLGMTVAFTSDAKSRWAAEWLAWPGFSPFWAQVVRHAMRKQEVKGVYVEVRQDGEMADVRLDVVDQFGRFRNQTQTMLSVIGPELGAAEQTLPMPQVAPGKYAASFQTPQRGVYHLRLAQYAGGQLVFQQARGLVVGYPAELRLRPANHQLLRRIAEVSGGQYNPVPAEVWNRGQRRVLRSQPLWPYLLQLAAMLFCGDVALRRVDLSLLARRLSPISVKDRSTDAQLA